MTELEEVKKQIEKLSTKKSIISYLRKTGFDDECYSCLVNRKNGVIVKFPYIAGKHEEGYIASNFSDISGVFFPDFESKIGKKYFCPTEVLVVEDELVFIQPYLTDMPSYEDYHDFRNKTKYIRYKYKLDVHFYNILIYDGRLVLHDW